MPLVKSASKEARSENIRREIRAGKKPSQAKAIAYSVARKAGAKFAPGGAAPSLSFGARSSAHQLMRHGLISSPMKTPGRADKIPLKVPSGSSIVPADVVSGLGQGNSLNGATILGKMMQTGPYGVKTPKGGGRMRFPRGRAEGGVAEGEEAMADILASDGEFVIGPESVAAFGDGDIDLGHKILNRFYEEARKSYVKELKDMKPPHN